MIMATLSHDQASLFRTTKSITSTYHLKNVQGHIRMFSLPVTAQDDDELNPFFDVGYRCIRLSWVAHSFVPFRERLQSQSVSQVVASDAVFF